MKRKNRQTLKGRSPKHIWQKEELCFLKNGWVQYRANRRKDFIRSKKIQSFKGYFWSFIGFTQLKI
jgi:hypothetical protein